MGLELEIGTKTLYGLHLEDSTMTTTPMIETPETPGYETPDYVYRIASDDDAEVEQAEALIRRRMGADAVLPRDQSKLIVALSMDLESGRSRVVAAAYICGLARVDSLVVDESVEGTGVSIAKGLEAVDEYVRRWMAENGLPKSEYFTFIADESKIDRMLELGYVLKPWWVLSKVVTLDDLTDGPTLGGGS